MKGDYVLPPPRPSRPRPWRLFGTVLLGLVFFHVGLILIHPYVRYILSFRISWPMHKPFLQEEFSWTVNFASKELDFKPCYGDLKCARLELPLDYWNGTNPSRTISLAVVKLPAKVPVTDPRYGGPILLNPGGPGGSGVGFVAIGGKLIQILVDSPEDPASSDPNSSAKYYDIIGFDPRGIGLTFPGAHCFNETSDRTTWGLREYSEGNLDASDAALGRLWSMQEAFGFNCYYGMDPGYDIKQFITTGSVARDMVELIEALGRHREREAESIFLENASSSHSIHLFPHSKARYTAGKEKLQYWGFSYGTHLGSTFASMFPDRVGRVVLDGVVNAENYGAALWSDNLHDTEKVMQYFYKTCAAAPGQCPLASPGSTADDIEAKVQSILADLYHNPMPMSDPDVKFPEVVTYSDIRLVTFGALYAPLFAFPLVADLFSALEQRNVSRFADAIRQLKSCGCQFSCGPSEPQEVNDRESTISIICGDGPPQDWFNATYFNDHHLKKLERISPTAGAIWSLARLGCTGWKIRPPYRYNQPYGGQTSHPILWVGNTADPVTPLISAQKMSSLFPSSVVLTQGSAGHCSLAAFSLCTVNYIRKYFHTGELPPVGTVCPIDASQTPFQSGVTIGPPLEGDISSTDAIHATAHGELARLSFESSHVFTTRRMPLGVWN